MPLSVFTSLHLGPLNSTGVVIQLANHSTVNPAGVLEDVLVRVDKLIFPANFYILDMKDDEGMSSTIIILGRPFMMTTRTKIDVHAGSLTMEIGDEKVQFNVLEAMKHPIEDHSLFCIDLLSNVVNNYAFVLLDTLSGFSSSLDFSLSNISGSILDERENYKTGDVEDAVSLFDTSVASKCDAEVAEITLGSKMLPSVEQPPTLELKPLPSHLKYVYLERDGKLLVIISALLTDEQEQTQLLAHRQQPQQQLHTHLNLTTGTIRTMRATNAAAFPPSHQRAITFCTTSMKHGHHAHCNSSEPSLHHCCELPRV